MTFKDTLVLLMQYQSIFLPVFFSFNFLGKGGLILSLPGSIVVIFAYYGISASSMIHLNKQWFKIQDVYIAAGILK